MMNTHSRARTRTHHRHHGLRRCKFKLRMLLERQEKEEEPAPKDSFPGRDGTDALPRRPLPVNRDKQHESAEGSDLPVNLS